MAAAVNETIYNLILDHVVNLSFYSNEVARKISALLARVDGALLDRLLVSLQRLSLDSFTVTRLETLLADTRVLNQAAMTQFTDGMAKELRSLATAEVGFQGDLFRAGLPREMVSNLDLINPEQAYVAAMSKPFRGRLLKEWAKSIGDARMARIRDSVRIGFTQGLTTDQMVRNLRGTRAAGYSDGLLSIDRRNATAVVRTAVQHMAATVRERFYEANTDIISGVVWVSTLDDRTSEQCQVRDGLRYTVDGKPVGHSVPWLEGPGKLHWNCRSTSSPITQLTALLGGKSTRASMDGPVPAKTKYVDWLKRQPADRQDQILGPTRGLLLRNGKIDVGRFWGDKGKYLTLDALRDRNKQAFQRAGV